jgi:hypothetical protein
MYFIHCLFPEMNFRAIFEKFLAKDKYLFYCRFNPPVTPKGGFAYRRTGGLPRSPEWIRDENEHEINIYPFLE